MSTGGGAGGSHAPGGVLEEVPMSMSVTFWARDSLLESTAGGPGVGGGGSTLCREIEKVFPGMGVKRGGGSKICLGRGLSGK